MKQLTLLYPVFAMAFLSLGVALILFLRRVSAIKEGLAPAYFRFNRGAKLSPRLTVAEQHYQNIFEMPQLFYLAMLVAFVTVEPGVVLLSLAWGYVGVRSLHSWVHLGQNNVLWRRNAFVASYLFLVLIWGCLFFQLLSPR